jgi:hypothetical protein
MSAPTVSVSELLDRPISFFQGAYCKAHDSKPTTIGKFLQCIESDEFRSVAYQVRNIECKDARNEIKVNTLSCVTLSGLGVRKKDEPLEHSGLLQLDFDKKDNSIPMDEIRKILEADQHILAVFDSISGGVKAIACIEPSTESHKQSFSTAFSHFEEQGLVMDTNTKDTTRLCFASYDPNLWIAEGEVSVFSVQSDLFHSTKYEVRSTKGKEQSTKGEERSTKNKAKCVPPSLFSTTDSMDIASSIEATRKMDADLEKLDEVVQAWIENPESDSTEVALWVKFIKGRYEPAVGTRNGIMCDFIAFAHQRFSREIGIGLSMRMRDLWASVCRDSSEIHLKESTSHWDSCESNYQATLSKTELKGYLMLSDHQGVNGKAPTSRTQLNERAVFRICRDLARYDGDDEHRPPFFYLSTRDLALRIGLKHPREAGRMLGRFEEWEILKKIKCGTRGTKGDAASFRWMLNLPDSL